MMTTVIRRSTALLVFSILVSFGFGAVLKQFLGSRFAIHAEAKWLPILIDPEVGAWACGTVGVGGCIVVVRTGTLTQQFELSVGPVVRF